MLQLTTQRNPRNVKEKRFAAEIANRLSIRFEQLGFKPYITWYIQQANIAASLGDVDMVDRVFEDMEARGLSKPVYYERIRIEALANALMVEEAAELFFQAKMPKPSNMQKIIEGFTTKGDYKGADEFWERVKKSDFPLDQSCYDGYIDSLFLRGDVELAEKIIDEKNKEGFESSIKTLNTILKGYVKNSLWDKVITYFGKISETGIVPSVGTYNYVMCAYNRKNDPVNALRVYFVMIKAGVRSNDWSLQLFSEALSNPRDGNHISEMVKEANGVFNVTFCRTAMLGHVVNARKYLGKVIKAEIALGIKKTDLPEGDEVREVALSADMASITPQHLENWNAELTKFAAAVKTLFHQYRAMCSIDSRFFHHPFVYAGYMEILSITSKDRQEVESLIKSASSVSFVQDDKHIQHFYTTALFFAARLKDREIAEMIMSQIIKQKMRISHRVMNNYIFAILPKNVEVSTRYKFSDDQIAICRQYAECCSESDIPLRRFKVLAWFLSRAGGFAPDAGARYAEIYKTAVEKMKKPDFKLEIDLN